VNPNRTINRHRARHTEKASRIAPVARWRFSHFRLSRLCDHQKVQKPAAMLVTNQHRGRLEIPCDGHGGVKAFHLVVTQEWIVKEQRRKKRKGREKANRFYSAFV
jgi:hypothetical protein